jgi:hypothetical protein
MNDTVLGLKHEVDSALGWLRSALLTAGNLATDENGEPNGWTQIGEVADRLGKALALLETALEPVAEAIKTEQECADEMSDKQDGLSY